jgi:Domain of unknown function (DUF1707)
MTNQYLWDRIAGRDLNLRASDADRERIADRLRKSHAEGRLDIDEFQQRLEHCYTAKTFGELGALVRDLPREGELEERRPSRWPSPLRLVPLVPILFVLIAVSATTGHEHHFAWLWIPVVFIVWRMFFWRRRAWAGSRRGPGDWI